MNDFRDFHALDAAAVNHLRGDVSSLTDAELELPTRCAGWNVDDLIAHMTAEHEAILDPLVGARPPDADVRAAFDTSAARWVAAFERRDGAPNTVMVPKFGMELPVSGPPIRRVRRPVSDLGNRGLAARNADHAAIVTSIDRRSPMA